MAEVFVIGFIAGVWAMYFSCRVADKWMDSDDK